VDIIVAGFFLIGAIILANVVARRASARENRLFSLLMLLANVPVLLLGLRLIVMPTESLNRATADMGLNISNGAAFGAVLVAMALWGILACVTPVRQFLGRLIPLKPDSAVHTLALVLVGYLVGQGALTLSQGGLAGLAQSAQPTSVFVVAGSELMFAALGLLGVGYLVRRRGRAVAQRLGLERPQGRDWLVGLGWVGVLAMLQFFVGMAWAALNPEQSKMLDQINTVLLADFNTVWEWLILAIAAGVGEELLFRGALQPVFGLVTTSVIFGLIHIQYGLSPLTLFVALLALTLGLIRRRHSTTMAIIVHVGYDFLLGLMTLLLAYLQQFMS
jgi:membrane protease YdiL (CAAX protease family)